MSDPLKPEPKPDDLTETTEPGSIELEELEGFDADAISAGAVQKDTHKHP
jgi:hypothetical protein